MDIGSFGFYLGKKKKNYAGKKKVRNMGERRKTMRTSLWKH